MSKKRKLAYLALLINTIVWGAAAPIVKPALLATTPERYLFYRFLIAAIVSLPFFIPLFRKTKLRGSIIVKIVLLELLGTTTLLWLIYRALNLTTAIEASFIYSTSPLFVTLAGVLFLRERQSKIEWTGLFVALAGTLLFTVSPIINGGIKFNSLTGNVIIVLQNILWAAYLVLAKRVYRAIPKLLITGISFWVGLTSFFLLSLPSGNPLMLFASEMAIPSVFFAVVYMAIFGSIVGATLYLFGQNLIEISEASIFTYAQALVALPLSIFWLGEKLTPVMILGAFVIALGVYLGEFSARGGGRRGVSNAH